MSTSPPPVRHGPGDLLRRYSVGLGLREETLLGRLPLRLVDLLAPAPHWRWAVRTVHLDTSGDGHDGGARTPSDSRRRAGWTGRGPRPYRC